MYALPYSCSWGHGDFTLLLPYVLHMHTSFICTTVVKDGASTSPLSHRSALRYLQKQVQDRITLSIARHNVGNTSNEGGNILWHMF